MDIPESLRDRSPGTEQLVEIENLLGKVEEINPQLRNVVEVHVFGGAENEEIARHLGCTSRICVEALAVCQGMVRDTSVRDQPLTTSGHRPSIISARLIDASSVVRECG